MAITLKFYSFIFSLFAFGAFAQSEFSTNSYDLGPLQAGDQRFADFELHNFSPEPVFILNIVKARNITIKYSTKKLQPDSVAQLRVQYNPDKVGKFKEKIEVHLSDHEKPVYLNLSGQIVSIEANQDLACPDFSVAVGGNLPQAELSIAVVDRITDQPIPNVKVTLLSAGVRNRDVKTVVDGSSGQNTPIGLYKISVSAAGYVPTSQVAYIGVKESFLTIFMDPEAQPKETLATTQKVADSSSLPTEPVAKTITAKAEKPKEFTVVTTSEPKLPMGTRLVNNKLGEKALSSHLPETEFGPNNIVFLIDISTSMNQLNKLELLKLAIIRLSQQLRAIDRISIVTYESNAAVLLAPTAGNSAAEIAELILPLEAKGRTAGGKGIIKAYEVLNQAHIEGGNNQILLATDGVFNVEVEDKDFLKTIKKNTKIGNKISVIGVKNKDWTTPSMQGIATRGAGNYIHIETESDTESLLLNEIKASSRLAE